VIRISGSFITKDDYRITLKTLAARVDPDKAFVTRTPVILVDLYIGLIVLSVSVFHKTFGKIFNERSEKLRCYRIGPVDMVCLDRSIPCIW
jgi:hypothetical protein